MAFSTRDYSFGGQFNLNSPAVITIVSGNALEEDQVPENFLMQEDVDPSDPFSPRAEVWDNGMVLSPQQQLHSGDPFLSPSSPKPPPRYELSPRFVHKDGKKGEDFQLKMNERYVVKLSAIDFSDTIRVVLKRTGECPGYPIIGHQRWNGDPEGQNLSAWPFRVEHPTARYLEVGGQFAVDVNLFQESKLVFFFTRLSTHRTEAELASGLPEGEAKRMAVIFTSVNDPRIFSTLPVQVMKELRDAEPAAAKAPKAKRGKKRCVPPSDAAPEQQLAREEVKRLVFEHIDTWTDKKLHDFAAFQGLL